MANTTCIPIWKSTGPETRQPFGVALQVATHMHNNFQFTHRQANTFVAPLKRDRHAMYHSEVFMLTIEAIHTHLNICLFY